MNNEHIKETLKLMSDDDLTIEINNAKRDDRHLFLEPSMTIYKLAISEAGNRVAKQYTKKEVKA
jgi:hypothetical protein